MPPPVVKKPASFEEFVNLIQEQQGPSPGSLWYRGVGNSTYKLQPTLYRHKTAKTANALEKLEGKLITRFGQRSLPFLDRPITDPWDKLFLMQHYGIPTRLLDWTENPFVALFFAVTSSKWTSTKTGKKTFSSNAAVWILNPVAWNRHALEHRGFKGDVLDPGDDDLKGYSPGRRFEDMNNQAVCLYGAHNSPRIVAQRGTFTILGQDTDGMETAFETKNYPANCLIKLELPKSRIESFRKAILNHGTTESVIFPDLEGLAREIKRVFGFEA